MKLFFLLVSFESLPQLSNPLLMLDPPLSSPFFQKLAQEQAGADPGGFTPSIIYSSVCYIWPTIKKYISACNT
jgi:hypothetical protein